MSIRLEAPQSWRVRQFARSRKIAESDAAHIVREGEREREYLQKIYNLRSPRCPVFDIVYNCSAFTLDEIARHCVCLMRIRNIA